MEYDKPNCMHVEAVWAPYPFKFNGCDTFKHFIAAECPFNRAWIASIGQCPACSVQPILLYRTRTLDEILHHP